MKNYSEHQMDLVYFTETDVFAATGDISGFDIDPINGVSSDS